MRNYLISDVLEGQAKLTTKVDKIAYLRKMNSAPLRDILRINFDDDIISMLPPGAPPYKKDDMPDGMNYTTLQNQYRKFKYFFKGQYTDMNPIKRESMFLEILESIHPSDAQVFIDAKDKNLKYKGLTKKLVMDAFPNLIRQ
jgi:hypothetical protein